MAKKLNTTEGSAKNGAKLTAKRRAVTKPAQTPKPATAARKRTKGEPTNEDIALRAYLIAERRHQLGLPGDAVSDWLQAEQELRG